MILIISVFGCINQSKDELEIDVNTIGERTDGNVELLDTIDGKVIATLKDNVLIETDSLSKNQKEICFQVKLNEKEEKHSKIEPNKKLISLDGKVIGLTKDTLKLIMVSDREGYVFAYLKTDNIKKNSIPELALEKYVSKGHLTLKELAPYLSAFHFKSYNNRLKLKEYFIYESTIVDISARDRISLLFNQNDNLIGIVHSRPLNIKNSKTHDLIRGHSFTEIGNLKAEEVQKIISDRINLYNSSD